MYVPDNILKHALRGVYFFCGTACGGKTTISKAFAEKHGLVWVGEDELNRLMEEIATPDEQPVWRSRPNGLEAYFMRPPREYWDWLQGCAEELLPLTLIALARACEESGSEPTRPRVAADVYCLPPDQALRYTEPNRIVYLTADPDRVAAEYFERPDHADIREAILRLPDPEAAFRNVRETLRYGNQILLNDIVASGLFRIAREDALSVERAVELAERHFAGESSRAT